MIIILILLFILDGKEGGNYMKKAFQWFGSKTYMLKYILPRIPEHKYYAELFGGGAVILLNKKPSNVEIYNDLDHIVYNFWKVITTPEKWEQFKIGLSNMIYHQDLVEEYYALLNSENDVEKAIGFFIIIYSARNGVINPQNYSFRRAYTRNISRLIFVKRPKELEEVIRRMQNVQFFNSPWQKIWKKIKNNEFWHKDGFVYLDPPYPHNTRKNDSDYNIEMTLEEHQELIEEIKESKIRILLSSYPNEIYDQLIDYGWKKKEIPIKTRTGSNSGIKELPKRVEVLYYNYELPKDTEETRMLF